MMSMMPEIWGKIFFASLATVVLAKLLGSSYNVFALFLMAFAGWTLVLVALVLLGRLYETLWWKPRKGEDQDKPGA